MATIVLFTSGTLGDHLPFIALGQALKTRGHQVRMVINQAMHAHAQRAGLEAVAITDIDRGPQEARDNAWAWDHWNYPRDRLHPKASPLDVDLYITQMRELIAACRDADLLIATSIRTHGYLAANALGIPWLTASMNPFTFWIPATDDERRAFLQARRNEYERLKELVVYTYDQLGVSKATPPFSLGWLWARHVLLASSQHFSLPNLNQLQPTNSLDLTGFWFYQDPDWATWQPDEALRCFCEPDDPDKRPIALTFSSQPLENPREILNKHAQAAARLGRPLLVQRGWAGFSEEDLEPEIDPAMVMFADYLPHDWLFARAACAIQHGGIGSIARALRQGCPILVEPFGNDQVYNATRVTDLGVGFATHPFLTTVDDLADILSQIILSQEFRQRAQELGDKIRVENGLETACEYIERFLGRLNPNRELPGIYERFTPPLTPRRRNIEQASADQARTESSVTKQESPKLIQIVDTIKLDIPKLIHQTWKDKHPPPDLASFRQTWQVNHPAWEYRLWTDTENRDFLESHYPWFLPIYDNYPEHIMRVDAVRYFLLYHYGGVYVDLDFESLQPIEPLLAGKQVILGEEPDEHVDFHFPKVHPFERIICNAFMASIARHPFWEHVFKLLIVYQHMPSPMDATGPFLLTRAYESYSNKNTIRIEPAETLYPLSVKAIQRGELNQTGAMENLRQRAYALHRWHCTWWESSLSARSEQISVSILSQGKLIGQTNLSRLNVDLSHSPSSNLPLVSCLMIVEKKPALARQSIHCFLEQLYPNKELVVVDTSLDGGLQHWIERLEDERITYIRVNGEAKTLGELRDLAVQRARGDFVAIWDELDLSDFRRLEKQIAVILDQKVEACFLERIQMWQPEKRRLWFSSRRAWENSLVCRREKIPSLTSPERASTSPIMEQILVQAKVALLDSPKLYTARFSAAESENNKRWEAYWQGASQRYGGHAYNVLVLGLQNSLNLDLSSPIVEQPLLQLDLPLPGDMGSPSGANVIPKIIHQTWKDLRIPQEFSAYQRTWQEHHPGWEYRLWTDFDNREFLRQNYAWFLPIYDGYREPIMRADAVRYFILHHFGGVYVDLDFESLRPIEPLLAGKRIVIGLEPDAHLELHFPKQRNLERILCNAFMASAPKQPYWEHVFKQLVAYHKEPGPLDATGPFLLTRAYESYGYPEEIDLLPPELLYPLSSLEPWGELSPDKQASIRAEAYAVHYWSGTWWRQATIQRQMQAKVTLLLGGEIASASALKLGICQSALAKMEKTPRVSCLMITGGNRPVKRLEMAQRAVRCFLNQTYPNKELVIIDDGEDDTLEYWIESQFPDALDEEQIAIVRLPPENKTLGELRNIAVDWATGDYIAQWDDDDLSDPLRLEIQLAVIHATQADACMLERHQIWWPESRRLAISTSRIWESSFVCARSEMVPYPDMRSGEDTPVIQDIVLNGRVAVLDMPGLYLYVFHGGNTFQVEHWESHWREATETYEGPTYDIKLAELQVRLNLGPLQSPASSEASVREVEEPIEMPTIGKSSNPPSQEKGFSRTEKAPSVSPSSSDLKTDRVLILVPVKDAAPYLPGLWSNLKSLTYPHGKISLAFLESDSLDGTYEWIEENLAGLKAEFARVELYKQDYSYRTSLPRWEQGQQRQRRSILAKSRNRLLSRALQAEDWVLWIDVDIASWPEDIIEQLLAAGVEIVTPHCLDIKSRQTFDLNTFKLKPDAAYQDLSPYMIDGILQPPKGHGRLYLSDLRAQDLVEVDSLGATMLLIKADIHRDGLIFPPFPYKFHIESEGLAYMARDMGYRCWGMPNLEIFHP